MTSSTSEIPIAWVERLFERIHTMYGDKFVTQWAGMDMRAVKTTWSEGLGGFTANEIHDALGRLLTSGGPFPPSLPEFRALCLHIPRPEPVLALPAPQPERVAQLVSAVGHLPKGDGRDWARRILRGDVPGAGSYAHNLAKAAMEGRAM